MEFKKNRKSVTDKIGKINMFLFYFHLILVSLFSLLFNSLIAASLDFVSIVGITIEDCTVRRTSSLLASIFNRFAESSYMLN